MKLLGTVLGFEVGDESDINSKMETESAESSTKREANTSASRPSTTTTTNNKPNEPPKTAAAPQNPVRSAFLLI